jgi:hypothetical protein
MVRIGKFDEAKILFKSGGHDHSGGTSGAHLSPDAYATGAVKYATSVEAVKKFFFGTVTAWSWAATVATITCDGGTGFSNVNGGFLGCKATVLGILSAGTSGPASVLVGASLDATIGDIIECVFWGT